MTIVNTNSQYDRKTCNLPVHILSFRIFYNLLKDQITV